MKYFLLILFFLIFLAGCENPETGQPYTEQEINNKVISEVQQGPTREAIKEIINPAYCGDNKCDPNENIQNCCNDCGCSSGLSCNYNKCELDAVCGNGIKEKGESSSTCCIDYGCPTGYKCDGNKCEKIPVCGNNIIEAGETYFNCCQDVGCPNDNVCRSNQCIELVPEFKIEFEDKSLSPSVTYLKATGYVGDLKITNIGNSYGTDVKVTISSSDNYFSTKTIDLGFVDNSPTNKVQNNLVKQIKLNFQEKILDFTTIDKLSLDIKVEGNNGANSKTYTSEKTVDMTITGRNYMTWQIKPLIVSWVTPTQPTIREFAAKATAGLGVADSNPHRQKMAARWIFQSIRSYGVKYVSDAHTQGDYIQFPYETLKNKVGDCDDYAVLYASLLESIGLKSFLMVVPGHIFSGYVNSDGYIVSIETTAHNFDDALSSGLQSYENNKDKYPLIYPTTTWLDYPSINLPEKSQLLMPSITKQVEDCGISFSISDGWIVKMPVKFVNSGTAPSAGCANLVVLDKDYKNLGEDISCWTINPGETKEIDYIADISLGNVVTGYKCFGE